MYIIVKSFNKSLLNKFCSNLIKSSKFNVCLNGVINMPKKQKIFTMLKSPHVHSKSKDRLRLLFIRLIKCPSFFVSKLKLLKFESIYILIYQSVFQ